VPLLTARFANGVGDTADFGCATVGVGGVSGVKHACGAGVEVGLAGATGVDGDVGVLIFSSFCCFQMRPRPKTATPNSAHNRCQNQVPSL